MAKILVPFRQLFSTRPYLTNAIVYGTLFSGAELSQQVLTRKVLVEKSEPLDWDSVKRYVIFGTLIQGPILTVWYRFLDKKVVGTSAKIIVKKVLIDQFLMTPHLVWLFFVAMSVMERKSNILAECKEKFLPTFQKSCMFWLPAQSINFGFIPSQFRVVYVGACSLCWVNILCFIKRQQKSA